MKKEIGLWIDHRHATLVIIIDGVSETKLITSETEQHVRYSGVSHGSHDDTTEIRRDRKDRRFDNYLNQYYRTVIGSLRDADAIFIFGPGEAKGELRKQIEATEINMGIVWVETTDKMTDAQIEAKVHEYFQD